MNAFTRPVHTINRSWDRYHPPLYTPLYDMISPYDLVILVGDMIWYGTNIIPGILLHRYNIPVGAFRKIATEMVDGTGIWYMIYTTAMKWYIGLYKVILSICWYIGLYQVKCVIPVMWYNVLYTTTTYIRRYMVIYVDISAYIRWNMWYQYTATSYQAIYHMWCGII